jgi:hypothetical protein
MNFTLKRPVYLLISSLIVSTAVQSPIFAEPIYRPSGPKLTFGGMTHRQMTVSDMGNPAYPVSLPYPDGNNSLYGAGLSIGLGVEYDGNDNLFELLNDAGDDNALAPGDGSDSDDGQVGDNIKDIIGVINPTDEQLAELETLVEEVAVKAVSLGAFLVTSVTDLNAKAFVSADVPILISNDSIGAWTFGANTSVTTNLRGLNDPIIFDKDLALDTLKAVFQLDPSDGITRFDLGDDGTNGTLFVDPVTGDTKFVFENNSATVTRAAQITEVSLGYSRKVWQKEDNKVYVGVKPKYLDVGLSNSFVFIADIEDAQDIFEALDKSNFKYSQDFSMDLGAIWSGKQYQIGATLTNINEPDFQFPEVDLSGISNPDIKQAIIDSQTYVMERQLKLEAGYITPGGAWGINFGYDANAVPDPMLDNYQWVSVGAGFASDNWWLPGARIGARKNMVGTKLTYVTAGVTVFNIVNLDVATTTDTIVVDGDTVPRGLILNIGAQVLF